MVKEDGWMMAAPQNYLAVIIVRMEPIAFRVVDRCGSGCQAGKLASSTAASKNLKARSVPAHQVA
jgi:hypothetical protein